MASGSGASCTGSDCAESFRFQPGTETCPEARLGEGLRPSPQIQFIEAQFAAFVNRRDQRFRIPPSVVEDTVFTRVHDIPDPTFVERDHGTARGQSLDGSDAEVLDAGLEQAHGAAIERAELLPTDPPEESGAASGEPPPSVLLRAGADFAMHDTNAVARLD